MNRENLVVIEGGEDKTQEKNAPVSPEVQLRHMRNVTCSLLNNALGVWSELYGEFEGAVTNGVMVTGKNREGFCPRCGWPEFLEKMWLLQHYLDHARRYCEGRD